MKAQQLVQYMAPRAMFGGVWNTSKSVYSSGSQLLLSRPSVSGAYLKKSQENQLLGVSVMLFLVPSSCLSFFFYRFHLYCFQHVAADVFSIFGLSCTVSSTWQVCVFFLAIESFRTTEFGVRPTDSAHRQKKIIAKTIIRICPFRQILSCSNLPTSSVELIWPITELYFRQILSTDFMNRFCQDVETGPKSSGLRCSNMVALYRER